MASKVVISNYWHKPGIKVTVVQNALKGGIVLEMPLDDYLLALGAELNHPFKLWTRAGMTAALKAASTVALEKVKETSTVAMSSP